MVAPVGWKLGHRDGRTLGLVRCCHLSRSAPAHLPGGPFPHLLSLQSVFAAPSFSPSHFGPFSAAMPTPGLSPVTFHPVRPSVWSQLKSQRGMVWWAQLVSAGWASPCSSSHLGDQPWSRHHGLRGWSPRPGMFSSSADPGQVSEGVGLGREEVVLACVWDAWRVSRACSWDPGWDAVPHPAHPAPHRRAFQSGDELSLGCHVRCVHRSLCGPFTSQPGSSDYQTLGVGGWLLLGHCCLPFMLGFGHRTQHSSSLSGLPLDQCLQGKQLLADLRDPGEEALAPSRPPADFPWPCPCRSASQTQRLHLVTVAGPPAPADLDCPHQRRCV